MSRPAACILTLGCPRNEVDSEAFAGVLRRSGWRLTSDPGSAGLLVVNTCAFIAPAVEESLEALSDAIEWRKSREDRILVLAGCLPGRFADDGSGGLEDIDLVIGPGDAAGLSRFLGPSEGPAPRARLGRRYDRYLKIADGCLNKCAFCVLPAIRGPFRPIPLKSILEETESLVGSGAREIGIVAQDLLAWRDGGVSPAALVSEVARRFPETWFRLYYLHPGRFDRGIIDAMGSFGNIAPYLDIPVQHASDSVLRRMSRGYGRRRLEEINSMVGEAGFDLACRFTVIAGYPGETRGDFDELCSFLRGSGSLRSLVVFQYWHEEGTPEFERGTLDLVDPSEIEERTCMLDAISEEAASAWGGRLEGRRTVVLAETTRRGRTRFDAPLVDGTALFSRPLRAGGFHEVVVDGCNGLDTMVSGGIDSGDGRSDSSGVRS